MTGLPEIIDEWVIDSKGRIFHDGRFVAVIERTPDNDSPFQDSNLATFRIMRVIVDGPDERMRSHARPFESSISGTSERVVLSLDEWNALNAAQETTR
jgi:hypothetical protein